MKTSTFKTGKVVRTIVVTLIVLISLTGSSKGVNSGKESVEMNSTLLTNQVKFWMSDNSNWNNVENQLQYYNFIKNEAETLMDENSL